MNSNVLVKSVRKAAGKRFAVTLVLMIIALGLTGIFFWPYMSAVMFGPKVITSSDEAEKLYNDRFIFFQTPKVVKFVAPELYTADIVIYETRDGVYDHDVSFFNCAFTENKIILIEFPISMQNDESMFDQTDYVVEGVLSDAVDTTHGMYDTFVESLAETFEMTEEDVRTTALSTVAIDMTQTLAIRAIPGFVIAPLGIVFAFTALFSLLKIVNPKNSKIYRKMVALGNPAEIEEDIQTGYENGGSNILASAVGGFVLNNYFVSLSGMDLGRTDELVWAFVKAVSTRYGTTYSIVMYNKDFKKFEIRCKNHSQAETFIINLNNRLPVLIGNAKEYRAAFKDKHAMLEMWQNRKNQFVDRQTGLETDFSKPVTDEQDRTPVISQSEVLIQPDVTPQPQAASRNTVSNQPAPRVYESKPYVKSEGDSARSELESDYNKETGNWESKKKSDNPYERID